MPPSVLEPSLSLPASFAPAAPPPPLAPARCPLAPAFPAPPAPLAPLLPAAPPLPLEPLLPPAPLLPLDPPIPPVPADTVIHACVARTTVDRARATRAACAATGCACTSAAGCARVSRAGISGNSSGTARSGCAALLIFRRLVASAVRVAARTDEKQGRTRRVPESSIRKTLHRSRTDEANYGIFHAQCRRPSPDALLTVSVSGLPLLSFVIE